MGDDEKAWSYLLVTWSSLVLPSCLLTRYPCTNNYDLIFLSLGGTRYDAQCIEAPLGRLVRRRAQAKTNDE